MFPERALPTALRLPVVVLAMLSLFVLPVRAQVATARLSGTVRDAATGAPISGAVVMLFDGERALQRRAVTGAGGEFRLVRTARDERVQVLRLGFRPREFTLSRRSGQETGVVSDTTITITMERVPNLLAGVRVTARASCPVRADAPVAFGLWQEARSALLASVVTRESQTAKLRRYAFVREMERDHHTRVTRMTVTADSATGTMGSFAAALTPSGFVQDGFASDIDGERVYFGPDAEVLLSDAFLDGYCIRLADPDRTHPERVGVRFTPVRRAGARVEIDGTLWIDTAARTLSLIDYSYLLADSRLRALRPGGQVHFADMPNGSLLIDRWSMRLAGYASDTLSGARRTTVTVAGRTPLRAPMVSTPRVQTMVSENGGALAEARWQDGTSWRGTFGTLTLRLVGDSAASLTGRELRLARSPYRTRVTANGRAIFSSLIDGPYEVFLTDERLRSIALDLTVPVPGLVTRGDTLAADVTIPTPESFATARCQKAGQWKEGDRPRLLIRAGLDFVSSMEGTRISIMQESAEGGWRLLQKEYVTGADGVATYCAPDAAIGRRVRIMAVTRDKQRGVIEWVVGASLETVPLIMTPESP